MQTSHRDVLLPQAAPHGTANRGRPACHHLKVGTRLNSVIRGRGAERRLWSEPVTDAIAKQWLGASRAFAELTALACSFYRQAVHGPRDRTVDDDIGHLQRQFIGVSGT